MKLIMLRCDVWWMVLPILCVLLQCEGQMRGLMSELGFRQILRSMTSVPQGRSANFRDVIMRFYGGNSTTEPSSHRLKYVDKLLSAPGFDQNKPTVIYAHGYVELVTDKSAQTIVRAYLENGQYNIIMLDWANLAFGNYVTVALDVPTIGKETGVAISRLIKQGFPVKNLHLVGHSLGVHLLAYSARYLAGLGYKVSRLTGLDPALPGYYPALLGQPVTKADARYVDIIHTDSGGYGTSTRAGHADWWPNGGARYQPGCVTGTIVFTDNDFCSHWRSWAFWAESVTGGEFLSKRCASYEAFNMGECRNSTAVPMGLKAMPGHRGNFYLRTSDNEPYALGAAGADPIKK